MVLPPSLHPDTNQQYKIISSCLKPMQLDDLSEILKNLAKAGFELPQVPEIQKKTKNVEHAPTVTTEEFIADQAYDGNNIFYLVFDRSTGNVEKKECVESANTKFYPIMNKDVQTYQVLLPSDVEEYSTDEEIMDDIRQFLDSWHEERSEVEREIDVLYELMTYLYDIPLPEVPYRRRLAGFGRGKSTVTETMGYIAYRGMLLAGCDSVASLRYIFDLWQGTAVIDEADFSSTDLYSAIIKILNIGYSDKSGWYRSMDPDDPANSRSQRVFGPKILATRERFKDPATESRCLTSRSKENLKPMPLFRDRKFMAQAQQLRNKLTLWRFRHWYEFRDKVRDRIETPGIFKEIYGKEGNGISSRLQQILTPLGLVASETLKTRILKLAERLNEDIESIDEDGQLEHQVRVELANMLMWEKVSQVNQVSQYKGVSPKIVKIQLTDLACKFIDISYTGTEYANELKAVSKKVAKVLRDRLGIIVRSGTGNKSYIYIDEKALQEIHPLYVTNLTNLTNSKTLASFKSKNFLLKPIVAAQA